MIFRARSRRPQISLLVPFRPSKASPERARLWEWLERYWAWELPDAEIVIGRSYSKAFSKTEAVNDAASRANGRTFVLLDSDAYIRGSVILQCAQALDEARRRGQKLWFIPYRHLYRMTQESTEKVLNSDPRLPFRFHSPPAVDQVEAVTGTMHGHHFGAMIQIMPREAFEAVGCMDPRFAGWGGEDVAFVRAMDTLWSRHKTVEADVLHLWHSNIGSSHAERMWEGQRSPGTNGNLASRYNRAVGDRARMRALVDEGLGHVERSWWRRAVRRFVYVVLRQLEADERNTGKDRGIAEATRSDDAPEGQPGGPAPSQEGGAGTPRPGDP